MMLNIVGDASLNTNNGHDVDFGCVFSLTDWNQPEA